MGFNYEEKLWGINEVDLQPRFLGSTRLKYALESISELMGGKLLELGCGGGAFSRALQRHRPSFQVTGIDISKNVLSVAKKMGSGPKYQQADIYHLPFPANSFDVVMSFDVFEHLKHPEKAIQESFRILKKGGYLHFFVPLEGNRSSLFQLLPKPAYRLKKLYTGHLQAFTDDALEKMVKRIGFDIKKKQYSCFYLYQLIDLSYFIFLGMRKRNAVVSVEGYLHFKQGKLLDYLLQWSKDIVATVTYIENNIYQMSQSLIPAWGAGGIHITAIKN